MLKNAVLEKIRNELYIDKNGKERYFLRKKVDMMRLFQKKIVTRSYDKENEKPVIKASICNGEQVAGFKNIHTGKIEEVMLIRNPADLENFKAMYGIEEAIEKEY